MGIFSRTKRSDAAGHSPATRGNCACLEHIDNLLDEFVSPAPAEEPDEMDEMVGPCTTTTRPSRSTRH